MIEHLTKDHPNEIPTKANKSLTQLKLAEASSTIYCEISGKSFNLSDEDLTYFTDKAYRSLKDLITY